jgi:exodeoxyribonuclease V gamma subunit
MPRETAFVYFVRTFHGSWQNAPMPGLKLHVSNHLEELVARLACVIDQPLSDPLVPDEIVVQSRGMARWVSLRIADLTGICMNCEFPFPRAFVGRTLRAFFPEMAGEEELSPDAMAWKINTLLPSLARKKEFSPVRNYLNDDDGLKAFQLSEKIADLFDQYLVYRPELLLRWERNPSQGDWQAVLWRELAATGPPMHLGAVGELLGRRMEASPAGDIPERVSIFGISSLPPVYMQVFHGLARHCDVHLFSFHPSQEYYGDDLTPKLRAKILARQAGGGDRISEDVLPVGNPLLVSLGRLNCDFIELQLETDERAGFVTQEQPSQFTEPPGSSMLAVMQGDILHARSRGGGDHPKMNVAPGDCSIRIHACHSPMREVEVLYDQLLDLFNNDPSLKPRDIIVMTPDIGKYAPFIQSVFAFPEESKRLIPFSIADRVPRGDSAAVEAFLALLALPGSRCTATEVFSLLDRGPIRARFDFTDDDMDIIRRWIVETGIRWGIDASHRIKFGLPALEANTWRAGFQRLLLGFAMAGDGRTMFGGVMPYDGVEGDVAETLGRFVTAVEALFELDGDLARERLLGEWPDALGAVADRFFVATTPAEVADLRIIQTALDQLRRVSALAVGNRKVAFRAVRHYVAGLLDDTEQRGGFLTGGVTFCALKPMRSIPARVIGLLGMDDQAFPRQPVAPGFDLMARERRCGDRSPRDDDRCSFLEAIVSARAHLHVSYTGWSVIDNEEIPPSVLVSELLDYLDQAFEFPGKQDARAFVTTGHRLHAFSSLYFNGVRRDLFSYSAANAAASRNLGKPPHSPPPLFEQPLPDPVAEARNVGLAALIRFFSNPAGYFVRHRLGIRLDTDEDALVDIEPFAVAGLERYQIKQELVSCALDKNPANPAAFFARGLLPLGEIGVASFHTLDRAAGEFFKKLEPVLQGSKPGEPLPVDLRLGAFSISGLIEPLYGGRLVQYRCATLKPKDWLRAWINHLAWCAASPGAANETLLVGEDQCVRFSPVADAPGLLATLLEIYWRGLVSPLPFFPESAFIYADAKIRPSARAKTSPIQKARAKWNGSEFTGCGEKTDAYMAFCFTTLDPLDDAFACLAVEVLGPMLINATPLGVI